jgi:hypothetical protein
MLRIGYPSSDNTARLKQKRKVYWTTKLERPDLARLHGCNTSMRISPTIMHHQGKKGMENVVMFDNAATRESNRMEHQDQHQP